MRLLRSGSSAGRRIEFHLTKVGFSSESNELQNSSVGLKEVPLQEQWDSAAVWQLKLTLNGG